MTVTGLFFLHLPMYWQAQYFAFCALGLRQAVLALVAVADVCRLPMDRH